MFVEAVPELLILLYAVCKVFTGVVGDNPLFKLSPLLFDTNITVACCHTAFRWTTPSVAFAVSGISSYSP